MPVYRLCRKSIVCYACGYVSFTRDAETGTADKDCTRTCRPSTGGSDPSEVSLTLPRARGSRALVVNSNLVNNVSGVSQDRNAFPQNVMTVCSDTPTTHTPMHQISLYHNHIASLDDAMGLAR